MNETRTFGVHALEDAGGIIRTETGAEFDALSYSRMKYGDRAATRAFATELADTINSALPEAYDPTPLELLVAYKEVPPACLYLSQYCLDILNVRRIDAGLEPGVLSRVYKDKVAATNYALATAEDRRAELDSIDFSLESSVEGKTALVIDDIRITGAAETKIAETILPGKPRTLALGYLAIFNARQAMANPGVEGALNASVVTSVEDLLPMIAADNFDLNIRTLKMIMNTDSNAFAGFIDRIPHELRARIEDGAMRSGDDFIARHAGNISVLQNALRRG